MITIAKTDENKYNKQTPAEYEITDGSQLNVNKEPKVIAFTLSKLQGFEFTEVIDLNYIRF